MRELVLVFTYFVCAFISVMILKSAKYKFSRRLFWVSWVASLIGAFFGGVFGSIFLHRIGMEFSLIAGAFLSFAGAWLFLGIFLILRAIPDRW